MKNNFELLKTIREVKKKGLTKEESLKYLKESGIINKNGNITKKYKGILILK